MLLKLSWGHQDNWSELLLMANFTAAVLPSETTLISPFLINCGYTPQASFDWDHLALSLSLIPQQH